MTESNNVTNTASVDNIMDDPLDDFDEALLDGAFEGLNKQVKDLKITKDSSTLSSENFDVKKEKTASNQKSATASSSTKIPEEVWSEEYFKKMTKDLEENMTSLIDGGDSSQLDRLLEQMMNNVDLPEFDDGASADEQSIEEKLKDTVEKITNGLNSLPINNLGNMMTGDGDGEDSEEGVGVNMLPFLEDIMQQFLSKDVLYPVFSETCTKYPDWLEKKKGSLSPEDLDKYSKQMEIMQQVVKEFDKESAADNADVKKMRFNTILELLQKMQEYGSPPPDLVGEDGAADIATALDSSGGNFVTNALKGTRKFFGQS